MSFAKLIGNERNKEILQRLLWRGRLGSTFVFAGPEGVGKRQFALTVAKAANCRRAAVDEGTDQYTEDSCDECPVCRRIEASAYSDVMEIAPEGAFIKIAQTRALAAEVYFRPREGRQRFFLIDEADRLREEAANSLLKTLEEPAPTSTIILLTSRPHALLPTILSRAQRLNFAPLTVAEMEKYLAANYRRPAPDTALLARITGGRIGQATAIDISDYRRERRELIELIDLLTTSDNRYRLLKAAEYLGKQERDVFEKKLEMLTGLLRDIFLLAAGRAPEAVINIDVADRLQMLAQKVELRRLIAWVEKIEELRGRLIININRQVATEALLLDLNEAPG
jgi:DNA polymerase-3 subunit delta'